MVFYHNILSFRLGPFCPSCRVQLPSAPCLPLLPPSPPSFSSPFSSPNMALNSAFYHHHGLIQFQNPDCVDILRLAADPSCSFRIESTETLQISRPRKSPTHPVPASSLPLLGSLSKNLPNRAEISRPFPPVLISLSSVPVARAKSPSLSEAPWPSRLFSSAPKVA